MEFGTTQISFIFNLYQYHVQGMLIMIGLDNMLISEMCMTMGIAFSILHVLQRYIIDEP